MLELSARLLALQEEVLADRSRLDAALDRILALESSAAMKAANADKVLIRELEEGMPGVTSFAV